MPAVIHEIGLPVRPDEIERKLKELWETETNEAARASLMNLAVYSEDPAALPANTAAIAEITQKHACRAILIAARPDCAEPSVQAWITAHCHTSRAGSKTVCCEQVTFLLEGNVQAMIPNIVFAHLDSDLPLYLWWQPQFPNPIEDQILTWVDRLIFDSREWASFPAQLAILTAAVEKANARLTLRDLNWARTLRFREAIAQIFDDPAQLPQLRKIRSIAITYGDNCHTTALLLIGWLAGQLDWKLGWKLTRGGNGVIELKGGGQAIELKLESQPGFSVGSFVMETSDRSWKFYQETESSYLHVRTRRADGSAQETLLLAPQESGAALVSEDLSRGSNDAIYLRALGKIAPLLL